MFPLLSPTVRELSDYSKSVRGVGSAYLGGEGQGGVPRGLLLVLGLLRLEPLQAFGFTSEVPELDTGLYR